MQPSIGYCLQDVIHDFLCKYACIMRTLATAGKDANSSLKITNSRKKSVASLYSTNS